MVDYGLKDRVALITGANNPQGIGATTAFAFAREGAKVVLVYKRIPRPFDVTKTDRNGADRYFQANAGNAAGHLAIWYKSKVEAITTWLPEHIHECAMVLRGWHLDMAHAHLLWPHFLHNYHWHTLRKDALPFGKACPVTIR
jgi:glycine/D-amino acid oxidase-like deaminating enzyme